MNSVRDLSYIQPKNFADELSEQRDYCLFLDIDGTLAPFTMNPKDSVIPLTTLTLLQSIQNCGVDIAVVTGRSLVEARQMLAPLQLPIAATHGLEIALDASLGSTDNKDSMADINSTMLTDDGELATIKQNIAQTAKSYNDFTIENKPYSVALHYRQNPALEDVAFSIMTKALNNHPHWLLKQGKYVWEMVPKGADKGTAILTLWQHLQTDKELYPIFIGDDMTDEAGFSAVQGERQVIKSQPDKSGLSKNDSVEKRESVKGMGIKVGHEPTCAHYYVHSMDEVTVLLHSFLSFCQKRHHLSSHVVKNMPSTSKKITRSIL